LGLVGLRCVTVVSSSVQCPYVHQYEMFTPQETSVMLPKQISSERQVNKTWRLVLYLSSQRKLAVPGETPTLDPRILSPVLLAELAGRQ